MQAETNNIWILGFDAAYIRDFMEYVCFMFDFLRHKIYLRSFSIIW